MRLVNQEFIQSFRVGTEYRVQDLRKILPFSGGDMQGAEHRVRLRPRKTQIHRAAVSGAVPKVPGASDHL